MKKQRISKVLNFRDLGGIITEDGHTVAPKRLLRSGHLHRLTRRGAKRLKQKYGLHTIVDLRLQSECDYKPDRRVPEDIETRRISPLPEDKRSAVRRDNREDMLREIMARPDGASGYMKQDYRELVTDPYALESYRKFVKLLLEKREGSVLWHCSQGKDRAGVAAAIVLMALGVSRDEIMRDYMRTHYAYRWINRLYYGCVCVIKFSRQWARSMVEVLGVYPDYLQEVFNTIDTCYGGTEGFLLNGLRLTKEEITRLRAMYLV